MIRTAVRKLRSHYHGARLRSLGQQPAWVRVSGGFEMLIDPSDDLDREFYLGTFEPAMRELIVRTVRDGDTCIDIGAQKGYVSLTLAKAVGSKGRVLAFEPDKRAAAKLAANINRSNQQCDRSLSLRPRRARRLLHFCAEQGFGLVQPLSE